MAIWGWGPKFRVHVQTCRRPFAHAVMHPLCHECYRIAFSCESLPWLVFLHANSETKGINTRTPPSLTETKNEPTSAAKKDCIRHLIGNSKHVKKGAKTPPANTNRPGLIFSKLCWVFQDTESCLVHDNLFVISEISLLRNPL